MPWLLWRTGYYVGTMKGVGLTPSDQCARPATSTPPGIPPTESGDGLASVLPALAPVAGFCFQPFPHHLRQFPGGGDRLQHLAAIDAQRIRRHRSQLFVCLLQQLLHVIGYPVLALPQLCPVARQVAPVHRRWRRHFVVLPGQTPLRACQRH